MNIEIHENTVFITSIYWTDLLDVDLPSLIVATEILEEIGNGNSKSNRGGFQSEIFHAPNYDNTSVNRFFEIHIRQICRTICEKWKSPFNAEKLCYWYNVNRKYHYNLNHWHPSSYVSGVFYIKVPSNSGNIVFSRPEQEIDRLCSIADSYPNHGKDVISPYLNTHHWMPPCEGRLILFPGHLSHEVSQNLSEDIDDRRISLSFNFYP